MTINKTVAAVLGAIVLVCGAAGTAQAGIRGILSVYNQSANPYHVFVEGQRIGTIYQGQTFRVPVNDWQGPTILTAIQAGSQGRIRFVKHVCTCQFARWELHTHWEQLSVHGGPQHGGAHPGHGRPHHGGAGAIGHGVGMIVRGSDPHNPYRDADLAGGIASIIAGALGR